MVTVIVGDALETLRGMESETVHCIVTSPPYYRAGERVRLFEGRRGRIT